MFKLFKLTGWLLAVVAVVAFGYYLTRVKPDASRPPVDFVPASAPRN